MEVLAGVPEAQGEGAVQTAIPLATAEQIPVPTGQLLSPAPRLLPDRTPRLAEFEALYGKSTAREWFHWGPFGSLL